MILVQAPLDCSQSSIFRNIIEIESFALRATHLADARSLGTFENQDSRDSKTRYI